MIQSYFKQILESTDRICKKTNKNRCIIFMDILYCLLKYQASPYNYEKFEFYRIGASLRKTYVTYGVSKKMIRKFNNVNYINFFEDKLKFAETFPEEFNRAYLNVETMSLEEFFHFCSGKTKFICKHVNGSQGNNIKVFHLNDDTLENIYEQIKKDYAQGYMLEEWIEQHAVLSKIYPNAVNCLRIITLFDGKFVNFLTGGVTFALDSEIANGSQPSIVAPVDFETGIINKPAATFGSELYERHPKTNAAILGVQLPYWNETKEMIDKVCRRVPQVGYIGWDVAFTTNGPVLIEGNTTPGYKYYQIPKHLEGGIGNKEKYLMHLK